MNKLQLTGAAFAVGAAALFSVAPAFADDAASDAKVQCVGSNACKGQGNCKTGDNSCKGTNSCKGKGVVEMESKEDCEKAGGKVEDKAAQ